MGGARVVDRHLGLGLSPRSRAWPVRACWWRTRRWPPQAGGPPRIEYELTRQGEQEYLDLLGQARWLTAEPSLDVLGAAVGLIEDLPRERALELLRERGFRAMREWRASITAYLPDGTDLATWGPVGEVLSLWLSTADAGAEWTDRMIRRLEAGAFTMAGE